MRIIGTIRPSSTERITIEVDSYEEARELLYARVPEGYDLIAIRTDNGKDDRP